MLSEMEAVSLLTLFTRQVWNQMQTFLCTSNLFYDKYHENEQNYFHLLQNKVIRIRDFTYFFNKLMMIVPLSLCSRVGIIYVYLATFVKLCYDSTDQPVDKGPETLPPYQVQKT